MMIGEGSGKYYDFVKELYDLKLIRVSQLEDFCEINRGSLNRAMSRGQTTFGEAQKLKKFVDLVKKGVEGTPEVNGKEEDPVAVVD